MQPFPEWAAPARVVSLQRFLARLIWACVLPLVLLAAYLGGENVRTMRATQDAAAADIATNVAITIEHVLSARIGALQILAASSHADRSTEWPDLYRQGLGFHASFGSHVVLADAQSRMLFNTRVPLGVPLPPLPRPSGRAAVPIAFQTGRPAVGNALHGPIAKSWLVAIAVPGMREGKAAFVVLTVCEATLFQGHLEQVALPAGWTLALKDGNGAVIARRGGTRGPSEGVPPGRFIAALNAAPWSVVVEIPPDIYNASLLPSALALAIAVLGATLVGVLGGLQAARRLGAAVAGLAAPVPPAAQGPEIAEIAAVRRLLDESARQRETAEAARRESEQRFRVIFEQAAVGIAVLTPDGRWLLANNVLCDIVGYPRETLLSKRLQDITHPEDLPADLAGMRRMLAGEADAVAAEKRYLHGSGANVWVKVSAALARGPDGNPDYFIAVVEDIQRRKEAELALQANEATLREAQASLERRVLERTADLEAANRELQAFDYSISHDLRAPLNRIRGFGDALAAAFAERLPAEARDLLARMRASGESMDRLVTDMLALSTIARGDVHRLNVDLSAMTRNILDSFQRTEPDRPTQIAIAPDVRACADPGLVRIVLENLLANAWKFTSRRECARIEFGCEGVGDAVVYFVRDNGAGFDPAMAGRLFEPFRRLHSQSEFCGTGIGLATVRRIVRRHGGGIWAQSAVDCGATFRFTLKG